MNNETENERKIVTILFADIANFTSFSESHDPEVVTELLERFLNAGTEIILQHGGFVDKYIGDCIMGLFGAPIAKANDSKNAVLAAVEIMSKVKEINATMQYPINIRIGIHTGLVIAGYIGHKKNRQYTVIGHAVNVAKRIQEEGEKNKIYVSESTYNTIKNYFDFKKVNSKPFKGLTNPIQIYEVLGIRKINASTIPFIGRKQYINKLMNAYKAAEKGKLEVVSVIGERGVGKSKLIDQFRKFVSDKNAILRYGRGINTQKFIPYSGVINIIKINLGIKEAYNKREIAKLLKERLNKFERYYIGILMSLSSTREYVQSKVLRDGIYVSLKSILERLSKNATFILILENADFIDSQSLEILNKLINELKHLRALFILTSTTRIIDTGITVYLKPFSRMETKKFIQAFYSGEMDTKTINAIYEKTKGNPLYIEEILISPNIEKDHLSIPFSIHESIMARVDNLSPYSKTLLQYAAVLGYEGNLNILYKITHLSDVRFSSSLDDLILTGFLTKLSENRYTFLHPLVHETVYNSILIKSRKLLHSEIAQIIESKYGSSLELFYETLAYHYDLSNNKNKSLYYMLKSGDRALSLHNVKTAIDYYKKAIKLSKSLNDKESYYYAMLNIGDAYYRNSNFRTSLSWYKKITGDTTLNSDDFYYKSLLGIAMNYERMGKYKKTISILTKVLMQLKEDSLTKARVYHLLSVSYFRLGEYKISLEHGFRSREIAMKYESLQDIAKANAFIGHSYRFLGDFDNSEKYHNENLEIGELTNDLMRIAYTYDSLASIYRDKMNYNKAEKYLQKSLALTIKMGYTLNTGDVHSDLAEIYILKGDFKEAYQHLTMAKKIFKKIGYLYELIILNRRFAHYYLKIGNYIRSAKYAKQGLELAKKSGEKLEEGRMHLLLGEIYFHINEMEPAKREITKAINIFKSTNAMFYLSRAKELLKNFDKVVV